jgi:Fe-S oxidoreductase
MVADVGVSVTATCVGCPKLTEACPVWEGSNNEVAVTTTVAGLGATDGAVNRPS